MISVFFLIIITQSVLAQKNFVASHHIDGDWNDYFRFVVNVGENAENFEEVLFTNILNLEAIKKMPGYESPAKTRISLSAYQLEHGDIVDFVKMATAEGFGFDVTVDGNLLEVFKPLTDKQLEKLTAHQKEYYYRTYKLDESSSKVTAKDAKLYNAKYAVTRWVWSELEKIKKEKPRLINLTASPAEVVPAVGMNFPKIHHWKAYEVKFKINNNWKVVKGFFATSNLTRRCLNHIRGKVSSSFVNFLRRTRAPKLQWDKALREGKITEKSYNVFINAKDGDKYKIAYAKTKNHPETGKPLRSGHIQFGQIINNPELIQILMGNSSRRWIEQYKKGKTFDHALPRKNYLPEIIFEDSQKNTISKLRAYFSEGTLYANADPDLISAAYKPIFSDPGNSIRVIKSTQFVATHPRVINDFSKAMSASEFEELFFAVDGNFSTETYSALPGLVSSRINDQAFTPMTKAILSNPISQQAGLSAEEIARKKLEYLNSLYSFDGHEGIYGASDGIKLHAKMTYIEYVDSHNIRHYVVIFGSGNLSVNAGKGNADGLIVFDTTDPELKKQIEPYFEGVKNNIRTKPLLETLLQKRLSHMIDYNSEALREVKAKGMETAKEARFIEKNMELIKIKGGKLTTEFAKLIKGELSIEQENKQLLEIASTITKESNKSAYSKNFVKVLRFYSQTNARFDFDTLLQALYLTNPQEHPYQGFLNRLEHDWLKRLPEEQKAPMTKKFKSLIRRLARFENDHQFINLSPTERMILADCDLLFTGKKQGDFKRIKTTPKEKK